VSIEQASKALAIRHAESFSPGFPRLYLDADIKLEAADAKSMFDAASERVSPALIVPGSRVITEHSQSAVKRFYRTWYNTRFVQHLGFGAGAYLLNQPGRRRFEEWPILIADDGYVRSQFNVSEIEVLHSIKVTVKAPLTTCTLIKVKSRSKLGNLELKQFLTKQPLSTHYFQNLENTTKRRSETNNTVSIQISALDTLTYKLINIVALFMARWQFYTGHYSWARDNSNR
jgi:hypothetical protein